MKAIRVICGAAAVCTALSFAGPAAAGGFVRSEGGLVPVRQVVRQRQHSVTGPAGGSASRSVDYSHQPGSTSRSVNAAQTGPNGASHQRSTDFNHQAGVGTTRDSTTTATGPNGAGRTRTVDYSHQPDGSMSRNVSVDGTRANGASYSDSRTRTRDTTPAGN
jgi:hypothetical protein